MVMTPLMEERVGSFITQDLWSKQPRRRANLPQPTLARTFLSLWGFISERCECFGAVGEGGGESLRSSYEMEIDIFAHLHHNVCHAEGEKKSPP